MSGQYPPPNPLKPNPYSRPSILQRTPSAWRGGPSQPTGLNTGGSSLNFYGSPHLSLPNQVPQQWARPGNANPIFGLRMPMAPEESQRIPSEYQQVETMDLSTTVQDVPKVLSARSVSNDFIKNGEILTLSDVNGDVTRTKTDVGDNIVTSVIATNPEYPTDPLHSSKVEEDSVPNRDDNLSQENSSNYSTLTNTEQSTSTHPGDETHFNKPFGLTEQSEAMPNPIRPVQRQDWNKIACSGLSDANSAKSKAEDKHSSPNHNDLSGNSEHLQASYLNSSALSVDTDESRLVVAESSADDIFGLSPAEDNHTSCLEPRITSPASEKILDQVSGIFTFRGNPSAEFSAATGSSAIEPHPSAENVEILLENMFNSKEEISCSSQNSTTSSVIVSNGRKTPTEVSNPEVDLRTPMKEEELAKTLLEDSIVESQSKEATKLKNEDMQSTDNITKSSSQQTTHEVKIDQEKEHYADDLMKEIEEKLEKLTESNLDSNKGKINPPELSLSVPVKDEPSSICLDEKIKIPVHNSDIKVPEIDNSAPSAIPKSGDSTSCNPIIEVETELEKMFAGIVEPVDETGTGSDNQSQRSVSENKSRAVRKSAVRRKRPYSRRASDNSVFGGASSGESTPVKKGRKRKSESGSERNTAKVKSYNEDSLKKRKLKDTTNDASSGKPRGPFIRVEGSKESPASVVVVNSGARVDDEEGETNARRKHSKKQRSEGVEVKRRGAGLAYSCSTLSARYNSDAADPTWVCTMCGRGPHCAAGPGAPAGDLFGPYRVPSGPAACSPPRDSPSDRDVADEQKRRGGRHPKSLRAAGVAEQFTQRMAKKGKRTSSTESTLSAVAAGGVGADSDGGLEVWLHGTCAQWAPGLCIIGTQLVGLEDAVSSALRTKCCQCGTSGAGLGCVVRNCPARVHYHCASVSGWSLNSDTFIARCQSHRTRPRP